MLPKSISYHFPGERGFEKGHPDHGWLFTCTECEKLIGQEPMVVAFMRNTAEETVCGFLTPEAKILHDKCVADHNDLIVELQKSNPTLRGKIGKDYWQEAKLYEDEA